MTRRIPSSNGLDLDLYLFSFYGIGFLLDRVKGLLLVNVVAADGFWKDFLMTAILIS